MVEYTFTPILIGPGDQTTGYLAFIEVNNNNQILFSNGDVYANGALTGVDGPSGSYVEGGIALNNSDEVLGYDSIQSNDRLVAGPIGAARPRQYLHLSLPAVPVHRMVTAILSKVPT
jgi:hypothetical protein